MRRSHDLTRAYRWLAGALLAPFLAASVQAADQDCDAAAVSRLLQAAPAAAGEARAVWFDRAHLRWPGVEAVGRFRLVDPARRVALPLVATPAPPSAAARFGWVGAGVDVALAPGDAARLPALLQGPLLLVNEDAQGRTLGSTRLQAAGAIDDLYTAAASLPDLGVHVGHGATAFRVWAPTARKVDLCLYPGGAEPATARLPMQRDTATGSWSLRRPGDLSGRYYTFLVDVDVPGQGLVRNRVTDPYSVSLTADSRRSYVARLEAPALQPAGWATHPAPPPPAAATDMVIYELHVRDFSIGDATTPEAHRGRYLAFTDTDSAGMRHLAALAGTGLTDILLLPVFDFSSVPESGCVTPAAGGSADGPELQATVRAVAAADCFTWGDDPWHFGAPEGSYASDAADGAKRVVELRQMVQALHGAGLRVGMDMVYNHTAASGQDPRSLLDRIVPGYYHRLDAAGEVERSTCCANTATENRMMAKLMIDTAVRWARQYRIDSFRFDLMGHQPRAAMEALRQAVRTATGRRIGIIGDGWNFGEVADGRRFVQASQASLAGSGIGTFSDRGRDALRGGSAGDDGDAQVRRQGFINGLHYDPNELTGGEASREDLLRAADLVRVALAGTLRSYQLETASGQVLPLDRMSFGDQPAGYASRPAEVVNYVENHDGQTLFDVNVFKLPRTTSREDRARVQLLGAAVVAFSQGVAYFHAGQDILRSKSMDRNSRDSGDAFNRIDWTLADNGFGAGLPPEPANGASWSLMQPLLADPTIKPTPAEIRFTRDAFLDLLRIRASSSLFRLRSADEVRSRLAFFNTGPEQVPAVIAARLDGHGLAGAGFAEIVFLINADKVLQTVTAPEMGGKGYRLHPVHAGGADRRAAESQYDPATGAFVVPARTAVVYVLP